MQTKPTPAHGLLYATVAFVLFVACWKAYTLLLGAIGLAILARRCWDWCRRQPDCPATKALRSAVAAVLAGAPFFFLLAVAAASRP